MTKILAYTVSYGDRRLLRTTVPALRAAMGTWCDWSAYLGAPSDDSKEDALDLLAQRDGLGIQFLTTWPENQGQHHATNVALKLAREEGYQWLLRLDDDIRPKTKKFLTKMLERLATLKKLAGDSEDRIVAVPKIIGLKNPLTPTGTILKGQNFTADLMEIVGGACRLMPVSLLEGYEAPIYEPVGRGDPESLADFVAKKNGIIVRFPDIRVIHDTQSLETQDTGEMNIKRRMGHYWPWLGASV